MALSVIFEVIDIGYNAFSSELGHFMVIFRKILP